MRQLNDPGVVLRGFFLPACKASSASLPSFRRHWRPIGDTFNRSHFSPMRPKALLGSAFACVASVTGIAFSSPAQADQSSLERAMQAACIAKGFSGELQKIEGEPVCAESQVIPYDKASSYTSCPPGTNMVTVDERWNFLFMRGGKEKEIGCMSPQQLANFNAQIHLQNDRQRRQTLRNMSNQLQQSRPVTCRGSSVSTYGVTTGSATCY